VPRDALQLQCGPAREVGRVVGGHVEDAHRRLPPTLATERQNVSFSGTSWQIATVPAGSSW
jgi:hypothetical protein